MKSGVEIEILRRAGLVDAGVLAVGLERGWATLEDVSDFAIGHIEAGSNEPDVVELAAAESLSQMMVVDLLKKWAARDSLQRSSVEQAERRWMFAMLKAIADSSVRPADKLERIEEVYAALGFPTDMQKCSMYFVPQSDRDRGIKVGERTESPLDAMNDLLRQLTTELRIS